MFSELKKRVATKAVSWIAITAMVATGFAQSLILVPEAAAASSPIYLTGSGPSDPVFDWDPVTSVATLTANIDSPLIITAGGITIDGNGYTITGDNTVDGVTLDGSYYTVAGVTLKNIKLRGFDDGINATLADNLIIENCDIVDIPYYGISIFNSDNVVVKDSSVSNCSSGITVAGTYITGTTEIDPANNNLVTNNKISSIDNFGISANKAAGCTFSNNLINETTSGAGIMIDETSGCTVSGNTVKAFSLGTINANSGGIRLRYSSNDNVITGNSLLNGNYVAIHLNQSMNNTITGNRVENNKSGGIYVNGYGQTVRENDASFNTGAGINVIQDPAGANNVVEHNYCANNTLEGIKVTGFSNATISNNICEGNAGTGLSLLGSSNCQIKENIMRGNYRGLGLLMSGTLGSNNNSIYWNVFDANTSRHVLLSGSTGNLFNLPAPDGGNYWSNWCTPDLDDDGFVDSPYVFSGGQDDLPLADPVLVAPVPDLWYPISAATSAPAVPDGTGVWYKTAPAVTVAATDNAGGSGIQGILYRWDTDAFTPYLGSPLQATEGIHRLDVYSVDVNGNVEPIHGYDYYVDTIAPIAPSITAPASGSTVNSPVTISGIAETAGETITLTDNGLPLGTATSAIGAGGIAEWTLVDQILEAGPHHIVTTATDQAGNISLEAAVDFTVALPVTITAPEFIEPVDGATYDAPFISYGLADPGMSVTVYDGPSIVGQAAADLDGYWFTGEISLDNGPHTLTAVADDGLGHTSPVSNPVNITMNVSIPAAPSITGPLDGAIVNAPVAISGTADPNTAISVIEAGEVIDTAGADETGAWSTEPILFSEGTHTLTATAGNGSFTSIESAPVNVTADYTAPNQPVIADPADGMLTNTAFVVGGTAEANATVRIYDGAGLAETVSADGSGVWTTPSLLPSDGTHPYTSIAIDAAGNESGVSNTTTVTVDTAAPAVPVILTPATGLVTNAAITVAGTGEPGATLELFDGPASLGTVPVDLGGLWSAGLFLLTDGTHSLTAIATDEAGNASDVSLVTSVTFDTAAPAASVASPVRSTDVATRTTFSVTWSAVDPAPSSGLTTYDVQYKIGANGAWRAWQTGVSGTSASFTGLAGLTYYFRSRAQDTAGNIGAWTDGSSTVVPYDQTSMTFNRTWNTNTNLLFYWGNRTNNGTTAYSGTRNYWAQIAYTGAYDVTLIITKRPNSGIGDVYIGATKVATVDFYSPTIQYRVPVNILTSSIPVAGTARVVVTKTKNPASKNTFIELDGIAIQK